MVTRLVEKGALTQKLTLRIASIPWIKKMFYKSELMVFENDIKEETKSNTESKGKQTDKENLFTKIR